MDAFGPSFVDWLIHSYNLHIQSLSFEAFESYYNLYIYIKVKALVNQYVSSFIK